MNIISVDLDMRSERLAAALARLGLCCEAMAERVVTQACRAMSATTQAATPILRMARTITGTARWVREIRRAQVSCPIVILAEGTTAEEAAMLLDAGADDVMRHEVTAIELAARLRASVRAVNASREAVVRTGSLSIPLDGRAPEVDGKPLRLASKEADILGLLALNIGRPVRREAIYESLYGLSDYQPHQRPWTSTCANCARRSKTSVARGLGSKPVTAKATNYSKRRLTYRK